MNEQRQKTAEESKRNNENGKRNVCGPRDVQREEKDACLFLSRSGVKRRGGVGEATEDDDTKGTEKETGETVGFGARSDRVVEPGVRSAGSRGSFHEYTKPASVDQK